MSTENYTDRQTNILNTWGKNVDLFFYSENEHNENQVIKVCDENNVEIKQISVFKKIQSDFYNKYEWFFFGDDDTFVNTILLENEINNFDKTKVVGQDAFGCWKDLHYPSGGAGFLVSNEIVHNFFNSTNYQVGWGDVTFGLNMKDKNIDMVHNDKFFSQKFDHYGIDIKDANKYITFHYIKDLNEMLIMDNICKKNTIS